MHRAKVEMKISDNPEILTECMNFLGNALQKCNLKKGESAKLRLVAEEIFGKMLENNDGSGTVSICVRSFMGSVRVRITCPGKAFEAEEIRRRVSFSDILDPDGSLLVSPFLEKAVEQDVRLRNRKNINVCDIFAKADRPGMIVMTLLAMMLGILTGFGMKIVPAGAADFLTANIFTTVYTLFLNALKLVVAPLVFCSITESISQYTDLRMLGRIAAKAILFFVVTSVVAIVVGFGVYSIFPIGDESLRSLVNSAGSSQIQEAGKVTLSLKDTVLGLIPTDIVSPFQKGEMLQLIVIAVMVAVSLSVIGKCTVLEKLISDVGQVFSRITKFIISFMPLAVFCSMANMVYGIDMKNLLKVASWVPLIYFGHGTMLAIYLLMIFAFGKANPFRFFKNILPAFVMALSTCSSSATMPIAMKCCQEKLRISPKVYTFAIPLGVAMKKDGTCIVLTVSTLFAARIFGVTVTPALALCMLLMIMTLAMGAPGIPGGSLVCMAVIFPTIGIPAEAITLMIGLYSLVSMTSTALNVTGGIAASYFIAQSEKMLGVQSCSS